MSGVGLVVPILVLGLGTYVLRLVGPLAHQRLRLTDEMRRWMAVVATVLLTALMATGAVLDGDTFAGWSRVAGVATGGILAWLGAPFVAVVLAAGAVTAGLRLLGVP